MTIEKSEQWWKKKANEEKRINPKNNANLIADKSAERTKRRTRRRLAADLDFQDKITAVSMRYFGKIATKLESRMPNLGEDLLKSNYYLSPNGFLAIVIFATILSIPIAIGGVVMALITHTMYFAAAAIIPLGVFGMGISMPKSSKSGRASSVDGELAFVIGYLSVLITGGVSPVNLFRRLSTS